MSHNTTEEFPYSEEKLVKAEKRMLSTLKTPHKTFYVPIKLPSGSNEKIWTISFNIESKNTPILLIHGFAAGSCFWLLNFDPLAKDRPVYALDIIGFGRSSRPEFEDNGLEAEKQIVDSIEEWRKEMNLEKFVLVGHSMGGYICTAYAIDYPDRVEHLVLCDPWGFSDRKTYPNLHLKALCYFYSKISPLDFLRTLGRLGPWWIRKTCDDIVDNYNSVLEDRTIMSNYIYHCNAQNPTFSKIQMGDGIEIQYLSENDSLKVHAEFREDPMIIQSHLKFKTPLLNSEVKICAKHHSKLIKRFLKTFFYNFLPVEDPHKILHEVVRILQQTMKLDQFLYKYSRNKGFAQICRGEHAFTTMVKRIGRARNPMIRRVNKLREDLPITILYGTNTWMDKTIGPRIKDMRPDTIDLRYIENAGHHIYSERAELFNEIVINVCDSVDQKKKKENVQHNGVTNGVILLKENLNNASEKLN